MKAGWTVQKEPPASQWEPTATLTLSLLQPVTLSCLTHPNSLLHPLLIETLSFIQSRFFTLSSLSRLMSSFHLVPSSSHTHAVFIHSLFHHSPPSSFSCFFTFSELSPSFSRWSLLSVRVSVTLAARQMQTTKQHQRLCVNHSFSLAAHLYTDLQKKKVRSAARDDTSLVNQSIHRHQVICTGGGWGSFKS